MTRRTISLVGRLALLACFGMMLLPATAFAQRRWVVTRPHRNRVVIYQPRPQVIYQRRPVYSYRYNAYGYSQPYYSTQYYSDVYSQPYYTDRYYSNVYARPYYGSRRVWASPSYGSGYYGYQPRSRRSGLRIGIRLR